MNPSPIVPIFDTHEHLEDHSPMEYLHADYIARDIHMATQFLKNYRGSTGTFNSYRREIERLLHWSVLEAQKPLAALKRDDIEAFVRFCQQPPKHWIGTSKPPRFIVQMGRRVPNLAWRPFVVTVSKMEHQNGVTPDPKHFELTHGSLRELFAILGSFYHYLVEEEYVSNNPVALVRQKSKFIRKTQAHGQIRRLSVLQWDYVMQTTQRLAEENPGVHERSLFILSALYGMYLRISELTASSRWTPQMNDFHRDSDEQWWFTTVGKGNKQRQIAVSDAMLNALKRWRIYLNLTPLPSPADGSALLPKQRGVGPIKNTNSIRMIVQYCFDKAIYSLEKDGLPEEADTLRAATVHWLRHTGISDDVKIRPREHVRDDAGHSSSAITDKYIDIELRERHRSAKKKSILLE